MVVMVVLVVVVVVVRSSMLFSGMIRSQELVEHKSRRGIISTYAHQA